MIDDETTQQEDVDATTHHIQLNPIDDFTLECLTNKHIYKKIRGGGGAAHETRRDAEAREKIATDKKIYFERIMEYTAELLRDETRAHNRDILEHFDSYVAKLVAQFEYEDALHDEEHKYTRDTEYFTKTNKLWFGRVKKNL